MCIETILCMFCIYFSQITALQRRGQLVSFALLSSHLHTIFFKDKIIQKMQEIQCFEHVKRDSVNYGKVFNCLVSVYKSWV